MVKIPEDIVTEPFKFHGYIFLILNVSKFAYSRTMGQFFDILKLMLECFNLLTALSK